PVACPCTIWNAAAAAPAIPDTGNTSAVELGVKFRADVDGFISGRRFYKSAANRGTHIANLWTANGALVATTTFAGESASGWQQAGFASPLPFAGTTAYTASHKLAHRP